MDPPAYAPPPVLAAGQHRSIQDLRAQIIANGSVLNPRFETGKSSDDHIELIVAKAPAARPSQRASSSSQLNEKQYMKMVHGPSKINKSLQASAADRPTPSSSSDEGKHYAVLIKRASGSKINVIIQGEPKDTVEEAFEWMLEQTEMVLHDMVVKKGRPADEECCIM